MNKATASRFAVALMVLGSSLGGNAQGAATMREAREVVGVDRVVMHAVGNLTIRQGPREHLEIEAEPHLLPAIGSEVRDGVLYLEILAPQFQTRYPLRFDLTVKRLDALTVTSSADVRASALRSESLRLDLSGSGNIAIDSLDATRLETHLTGSADFSVGGGTVARQTLYSTGSGNYETGDMASTHARVDLSGSGDATVRASGQLEVRSNGSGDLRYLGNPRIDQQINGSGDVLPAPSW
ncbi:MAG: DUF2807 domain-containing protein [Rhodocyclaceae bacterium]|nr:DUF2807 domain-containing protein [Rhodocyclaceae bacterium]